MPGWLDTFKSNILAQQVVGAANIEGTPPKPITSSDIKAPTGWLDNYAVNDNTKTSVNPTQQKNLEIAKQQNYLNPKEVVYDTNKKFTKDYFGDPSIGSMVDNGLANMNQIPAGRTINDIVNAGFTGELGLLGVKSIPKVGNFLGELAAPNAYKYNPWAYGNVESKLPLKYRLNPMNENVWVRQVGKDAKDDLFNTGVVREKGEEVSLKKLDEFNQAVERGKSASNMGSFMLDKRPKSPYFAKGELFYKLNAKPLYNQLGVLSHNPAGRRDASYMIETALPDESFQSAYGKSIYTYSGKTEPGGVAILKPDPKLRDIDNFKVYKKDWLKGYKKVQKPSHVTNWLDQIKLK